MSRSLRVFVCVHVPQFSFRHVAGSDIQDNWESMLWNLDADGPLVPYAGPGGWNGFFSLSLYLSFLLYFVAIHADAFP